MSQAKGDAFLLLGMLRIQQTGHVFLKTMKFLEILMMKES
jgi:hypothetical protein